MENIPFNVAQYIHSVWISKNNLVYFFIDKKRNLVGWNGNVQYYGLPDLVKGIAATDQIFFLEGFLPVAQISILEFLCMGNGHHAHVHLIPSHTGTWVILFDASCEHDEQQKTQQRNNELSILTYRQNRLIQKLGEAHQLLEKKLMMNTPKSTDVVSHLPTTGEETSHVLTMIGEELELAKKEIKQMTLQPTRCYTEQLLEDLKALLLPSAQEKGIVFKVNKHANLPSQLFLDDLRFRQMLINLTIGAFECVRQGVVRVLLSWEEGKLIFAISSNDPTMHKNEQEKMLQAFLCENKNDEYSGIKIGLTTSNHIVTLMGGELKVELSPVTGFTFNGYVKAKHFPA